MSPKEGSIMTKTVEILFQFCRVGEIDTMNDKFQAEVYIESKWVDKLDGKEYDPEKSWNPQLYIENAIQTSKLKVTYKEKRLNTGLSEITEIRHVVGICCFMKLFK